MYNRPCYTYESINKLDNIHLNLKKQIQLFSGAKNHMNLLMFYNHHHKSTNLYKILGIGTYTGRFFFFLVNQLHDIFSFAGEDISPSPIFYALKAYLRCQSLFQHSNFCCSNPKYLPLHSKH